jgi:hypothetical protein
LCQPGHRDRHRRVHAGRVLAGGNAITDFATALLNFNLGDSDAN